MKTEVSIHHDDVANQLNSNEHIVENPTESRLLNASKISGRTQKKLGIGFFNAVTDAMYATVADDNHNTRKIQTAPLTNYNIFVLDQSLKYNSSVSFINTNVMRSGTDYDANVTAFLFDLNNKKNMYEWQGKIASSSQFGLNAQNTTGYSHYTAFGKTGGRFNYQISQELVNDKYDINDLGILYNNNYLDHSLWVGYKWIKPTKWYNNIYLNFNVYYSRRFLPSDFQAANINFNVNGQLKNLSYAGASIWYEPTGNDYYEPRTAGRVFRSTEAKGIDLFYSSNSAKKYFYSIELLHALRTLENGRRYDVIVSNRYRFNNKFSVSNDLLYRRINNSVGFADNNGSDIIFGRRTLNTVENIFNIKYNFTNLLGITTRIRHYWTKVDYKEYFTLLDNGDLDKNNTYTGNADNNFNAFNVDAVFTWQFAPGSFINVVWKNAIYTSDADVMQGYFGDLNQTIKSPPNNNISFKVLFFIDYLKLKPKKQV